jgi:hypothetical protein
VGVGGDISGAGRRRGHQWGCVADTTDGRPGPSVLPGSDQDHQGKSRRPARLCPFFASVASRQSRSARAASCLKYASCVLALPGFPSAVSHCSPSSTEAPRPISAPSPLAPSLVRFLRQVGPDFSPSDQEPQCQGAKPRAALLVPSLSSDLRGVVPVVFPGSFFAPVASYLCCLYKRRGKKRRTKTEARLPESNRTTASSYAQERRAETGYDTNTRS